MPWSTFTNHWVVAGNRKPQRVFGGQDRGWLNIKYTTGVAINDNNTDSTNAPMTAIAKGFSMSEPAPMP